jgi:acyl-CoA reductase-like NAD-dependent aldehyde dehydrogenase
MKIASTSPQSPSDIILEVEETSPSQLASIVASARSAQEAWWKLGAAGRANALTQAADALSAQSADAAALITREVGKPAVEAAGEVGRAVAILRYYAQASFGSQGDVFPPSLQGFLWSERRPHGVAGLITPWNFPMAIPLWKSAPALAAGNAVVIKPSPDAIAGALFVADIMNKFLPAGLFTVVIGGADLGAALVQSVDVVSFTGSSAVGKQVAIAATSRGIPVQAEMGGQNPAIVLPDADIETTANLLVSASMWFAGQKCTCTRRVITVGKNDALIAALIAKVNALGVGDPADKENLVGPLINLASVAKFENALESAQAIGATVLAGGSVQEGTQFVAPTVLSGVPADHPLSCEEVFGPLVTVHEAANLDEAIALANAVPYGLAASIHGKDHDSLMKASKQLHAGMIKINAGTTGVDFYAPFGGEKESSIGMREQGTVALQFYSTTHTVTYAPHQS